MGIDSPPPEAAINLRGSSFGGRSEQGKIMKKGR